MAYPQSFSIIKALTKRKHVDKLCSGNLILRHYNYYSNSESELQYGTEFEKHRENLVMDAFIFCVHKKPYYEDQKKYYVEIKNPCKLFNEIQEILKPILIGSYFAEIKYFDTECNNGCSTEILNDLCKFYTEVPYSLNLAFSKEIKYSCENEARMCFFYDEEKFAKNLCSDQYKFSFFKKIFGGHKNKMAFDSFEKWLIHRKNNSEDYVRDYWTEVEIKIHPKYFQIL